MQDRFKFRVWNKAKNKFEQDRETFIMSNGELVFMDEACRCFPKNNPNYIISFCTGLKDKNGKLIYEGDIVNGTCGVYWGKMIVKFNENEAKFYMYRIDKRYTDLHFHGKNQEDNFELEVIGNIYENPELLEV